MISLRCLVCWVAVLGFAGATTARADEKSHKKAAEDLLMTMQIDKVMADATEQMLELQIKQNPAIAQLKPVMKAFLNKHVSWNAVKDDLVKLYAEEFSEKELQELTAFYKTPAGKKFAEKQSKLSTKGMELGMKRVQDNQAELRQMIEESLKKQ